MTAGQPEGVGQQQGREVWRVGRHYGIHVYAGDRPVATFHNAEDADSAVRAHNAASSPTPPARDSGRDEAREAVARWLREKVVKRDKIITDLLEWDREHPMNREGWLVWSEELLALPELDKLLRRPA